MELTRSAFAWLLGRGVERGRARAVAHVGVELLLDAELAREEPVRRTYIGALRRGAPRDLGAHLVWASPDGRREFEDLRGRLLARGASGEAPTAAATTLRLRRALATRPRLALDDVTEMVARDWVVAARPLVAARAGDLARELSRLA